MTTGKRVTLNIEFFWRGKKKRIPSVGFIFQNDTSDGIKLDILDSPEFKEFSKAAHALCKKYVDAGELD